MDNPGRRGRRFLCAPRTALLAGHAIAGFAPGDHACASYGSDDEHRALVARYGRQAMRRGERLLYLAQSSDDASVRRILAQEGIDVDTAIALRQIEVLAVADICEPFDPEAAIAKLQAARRAALHDGYSALSVAIEMSWALRAPAAEIEAARHFERHVNRVFSSADIVGLCLYDRRLGSADALERLVTAHDFQLCTGPNLTTATRRRLTVSEREDGVVALSGALDIDSSAYLAARLAELDGEGDVVIHTSGLGFADVSGTRALVRAAEALGRDRHLVLPDASAALVRVLELCGWTRHGRITLA